MWVPEGSQDHDYQGRRLVAGVMGTLPEYYVSWLWRGERHIIAVGLKYGGWIRHRKWRT